MAAPDKIVYHLHSTQSGSFQRAVTNLENLQNGLSPDQLDIKLLLQGESIQLLNQDMHRRTLNQRIQMLRDNGLVIEVGRDNYRKHNFQLEQNTPPHLVKNIFTRLIELQQQGYHYITP